jgi:hypothetical protein
MHRKCMPAISNLGQLFLRIDSYYFNHKGHKAGTKDSRKGILCDLCAFSVIFVVKIIYNADWNCLRKRTSFSK